MGRFMQVYELTIKDVSKIIPCDLATARRMLNAWSSEIKDGIPISNLHSNNSRPIRVYHISEKMLSSFGNRKGRAYPPPTKAQVEAYLELNKEQLYAKRQKPKQYEPESKASSLDYKVMPTGFEMMQELHEKFMRVVEVAFGSDSLRIIPLDKTMRYVALYLDFLREFYNIPLKTRQEIMGNLSISAKRSDGKAMLRQTLDLLVRRELREYIPEEVQKSLRRQNDSEEDSLVSSDPEVLDEEVLEEALEEVDNRDLKKK